MLKGNVMQKNPEESEEENIHDSMEDILNEACEETGIGFAGFSSDDEDLRSLIQAPTGKCNSLQFAPRGNLTANCCNSQVGVRSVAPSQV